MDLAQGQKVYGEIVQKAWDDNQFKNNLISNPIETIENFTGNKVNLTNGQTLVVKDQTDESIVYLNIPRKVDIDELELTDEQLEVVAGGTSDPVTVAIGLTLGAVFISSLLVGYTTK